MQIVKKPESNEESQVVDRAIIKQRLAAAKASVALLEDLLCEFDNTEEKSLPEKMAINIGIKTIACKDCDKFNKGVEIHNMFDWKSAFKAITFDSESQEILLIEEQFMRIVQMVNPFQKVRRMRLISQDQWMDLIRTSKVRQEDQEKE
jgi:hypothetical protein